MGHDPPGHLTRLLHPRSGRHGDLPEGIIPVGRSVVVPANGSLPNIVLSPRSIMRVRQVLAEEQFDLIHLHEPMTPAICVASLSFATCADRGDLARGGRLGWMRGARRTWGFLVERIDARIAVSRMAAESAERWLGPGFEIVPNGVVVPEQRRAPRSVSTRSSSSAAPRGAQRPAGAAARLAGDPAPQRRAAPADRHRSAPVPAAALAAALRRGRDRRARDRQQPASATASSPTAKLLVSPALGGESFGMVLIEAFAQATPVVASNIPGFAEVAAARSGRPRPPRRRCGAQRRGRRCPRRRAAEARDGAGGPSAGRGALRLATMSPRGWRRSTSGWPRDAATAGACSCRWCCSRSRSS